MSEEKVVIEEPQVEEAIEIDTSELSPEELTSAKELGIVKNEEEPPKEDKKKEAEKEPEGKLDPETFEEMEEVFNKDEKKFRKDYTFNAKGLFFKYKSARKQKQEAERLATQATKDKDFYATKEKIYLGKMAEVTDILDRIDKGDETITTADIRKVLALQKETEKREEEKQDSGGNGKAPSPEEQKQKEEFFAERVRNTVTLGQSKYDDYDNLVTLANEVWSEDSDLREVLAKAFLNPEVGETELVEKIVKYAKLNPKFGEEAKPKPEKKNKEELNRMVANANKKKTSASLTTGSGRREISHDDLTIEDVPHLSQKQWNELPDKVRERLIKEAS